MTVDKEGFMSILAEIWPTWATSDTIQKAAKLVGVSKDGLNVDWMNQEKFHKAEILLGAEQQTLTKSTSETFEVTTPEGMRRYSNEYYKYKLQKSMEHIQTLQKILATETEMNLEEVPGLLQMKKVRPKKTKSTRITSVHGSMAGSSILEKLQLVENEKEEADRRKETQAKEKDDLRRNFEWCKDAM